MKVLDVAHRYQIAAGQTLQFLKKEMIRKGATSALTTTAEGTTNEELIEVLLDRLVSLQAKHPCRENALAITKLEEALMWLEARTRKRVAQRVEGTDQAHRDVVPERTN